MTAGNVLADPHRGI